MSCVTDIGFVRPSYAELLAKQEAKAKELFGDDIDTSETSILGKIIRMDMDDLNNCYETLEDTYYARFPNTARGQSLDRLSVFVAAKRDAAVASKISVKFIGNAGASVPAAFLITDGNVQFYVIEEAIIGSDGTVTVNANCTQSGIVGNIAVGSALSIVNPSADIASVELVEIISYGSKRENDTSFRAKFNRSAAGSGSATENAIKAAIYRVPLVDGASVIVNETDQVKDGIPPHSFACYVLAPESQDQLIAEAIFSKKPTGIPCVGDVELSVYDEWNKARTVRFYRTIKLNVYIRMTVNTNKFFETDGLDAIKSSLMEYINNLANGDDVYYTSLFGYIHQINGVVNVPSLTISTNGSSYSTTDIVIGDHQIARVSVDNIEIEVS